MGTNATPAPAAGSMIKGVSPTVFVADLDRAVRFYTDVLGLKLLYQAGPHFAMIDAGGGTTIGLHPPGEHHAAPGTAGAIQIGLNVVQPIERVVESLQTNGVAFVQRHGRTIVDDGPVKLAFFHDPDGTELYLCEVVHGS